MFVTPLVVGFLALVALERRWARPWTWCAAILVALTAHAIAHALLVSTPYTERIVFHALHGRSVTAASRLLPPLVLGAGALALLLSSRFKGSAAGGPCGASGLHRDSRRRGIPDLAAGDRRLPGDAHQPSRPRAGGGGGGHLDPRRPVGADAARGRAAADLGARLRRVGARPVDDADAAAPLRAGHPAVVRAVHRDIDRPRVAARHEFHGCWHLGVGRTGAPSGCRMRGRSSPRLR